MHRTTLIRLLPSFWLLSGGKGGGVHIAFRAQDRGAVDRFFKAGAEAGGRDNGGPGIRKDYSPTYYAAFLYDPDGNNIEAVSAMYSVRAISYTRSSRRRPESSAAIRRDRRFTCVTVFTPSATSGGTHSISQAVTPRRLRRRARSRATHSRFGRKRSPVILRRRRRIYFRPAGGSAITAPPPRGRSRFGPSSSANSGC